MKINEDKFIAAINNGETFKTEFYETNYQKRGELKNFSQVLSYRLYDKKFQELNIKKLQKLGILEG